MPFHLMNASKTATKNFIFDAGTSIFDDDDIKRAYVEELYRITRPGYIEKLKQKYDLEAQGYDDSPSRTNMINRGWV